jgi:hypothetical protein
MSWVRVDDKIAFHRKVVAAGNEAFGAWMRMTAWCADQLSDGIVPASIAWIIAGHGREEVIEALVKHNLLEREADHFLIHDYHDHNPLAADVKAKRNEASKKKKEAGAKGGRVSGEVRSSKSEASTKQTGSKGPSKNEAKRSPVPNPHPVPNPPEEKAAPAAPNDSRLVVEAWEAGWIARFKPTDGKAPPATGADYKNAKGLIATYGLQKTIELVSRFLDDTDRWVAERGHMLRDLPSRVARYAKGDGPLFKHGNTAPSANFAEAGDKTAEYT